MVHVWIWVEYGQGDHESCLYVLIMLYLHTRDHAVPSRSVLEALDALLGRHPKILHFFQKNRLWELPGIQLGDRTHVGGPVEVGQV